MELHGYRVNDTFSLLKMKHLCRMSGFVFLSFLEFHLSTIWLKNAQLDQLYAIDHDSPQLTILKEIRQFLKAKDYFILT